MSNRMLEQAKKRIASIVVRGLLDAVNDSGGVQLIKAELLAGEPRGDIERAQNYGITSNPPPGSEVLLVSLGGDRGRMIAVSVDSRSLRPKNLPSGEFALWDKWDGIKVLLKQAKLLLGGADAADPLVRKSDLEALVAKYNAHTHVVNTTGTAAAQSGTAQATTSTHTATASAILMGK